MSSYADRTVYSHQMRALAMLRESLLAGHRPVLRAPTAFGQDCRSRHHHPRLHHGAAVLRSRHSTGDCVMATIDSSDLCVTCGGRLRLVALSRCRPCVQAVADVDRQKRAAAEARVAARWHGEAADLVTGASP